MIEISEIIWKKDELNDFEFADCNFKMDNNLSELKKSITISQFENDNYFAISLENKIKTKQLTKLLNSDFNSIIKEKDRFQDYEIYLPYFQTDNELFDTITTVVYVCKHDNECYIRIQIAQDFSFESPKWKKYSPHFIYDQFIKLGTTKKYKNIKIEQGDDDTEELVRIIFKFELNENINDAIKTTIKALPIIEKDLLKQINSETWIDEFNTDEKLFSVELILPLIRRMEFLNIRYNHGVKEYGKDFLFSEINKFGEIVNYGMQIKAGSISGKVNSQIDIIIGQINDAFSMPFNKLGDENDYYITTLIIVISGYFTDNAKDKIKNKIGKGLHGSIYFWDKDKLMELVEKYWNK